MGTVPVLGPLLRAGDEAAVASGWDLHPDSQWPQGLRKWERKSLWAYFGATVLQTWQIAVPTPAPACPICNLPSSILTRQLPCSGNGLHSFLAGGLARLMSLHWAQNELQSWLLLTPRSPGGSYHRPHWICKEIYAGSIFLSPPTCPSSRGRRQEAPGPPKRAELLGKPLGKGPAQPRPPAQLHR